jgi:hypothetical protein
MKCANLSLVLLASLSFSSVAMAVNCEPIFFICPIQQELQQATWQWSLIKGKISPTLSPFSGTFFGVIGDPKEIVINNISSKLKDTNTQYIFSCNYTGPGFRKGTLTMTLQKEYINCVFKNNTMECCPRKCGNKCSL